MNLSVNGQSKVPPGFRFHPTEEELLQYYLKKKVASQKIDLDVIRDIDLNKLEPWDIQEKCRIGSGPQNDWYFFSHKDKKYPTGTRTNRATAAGFWKATGRDKMIYGNNKPIGMRKTLVFYKGRAPHGEKSEWIMHEYRLQDSTSSTPHDFPNSVSSSEENGTTEEGWVICRVFRKKNFQKTTEESRNKSLPLQLQLQALNDPQKTQLLDYSSKKVLNHLFSCIDNTTTTPSFSQHNNINNNNNSSNSNNNTVVIHDINPSTTTTTSSTTTGTISDIIPVTYTSNNNNNNNNNNKDSGSNNDDNQLVLNSELLIAENDDDDDNTYDLPMLICSSSSSPPSFDDDPILNAICFDNQRLLYHGTHDKPNNRLSDWMTLYRLIASQLNGHDQHFGL